MSKEEKRQKAGEKWENTHACTHCSLCFFGIVPHWSFIPATIPTDHFLLMRTLIVLMKNHCFPCELQTLLQVNKLGVISPHNLDWDVQKAHSGVMVKCPQTFTIHCTLLLRTLLVLKQTNKQTTVKEYQGHGHFNWFLYLIPSKNRSTIILCNSDKRF